MTSLDWGEEFPGAITVYDAQGTILTMNARSAEVLGEQGGKRLVGSNALDCHPEPSRTKFREMLASGQRHVYTIEKAGVRKLIHQTPWYRDGAYGGFVELSLELPAEMPHFVRSP